MMTLADRDASEEADDLAVIAANTAHPIIKRDALRLLGLEERGGEVRGLQEG